MQQGEYSVEVDQATEADWSSLVGLFADANLYQTRAYGAISWGAGQLSQLVLRRGSEVVSIAQLRIARTSWLRCGMAQLRWGPLCHRNGQDSVPEAIAQMAAALRVEYVEKRGLFLRILPNAYQSTPRGSAFESAFSMFSSGPFRSGQTHRTLVVDLSPSLDELRRKLDQKWRNQLNRAEKNGLELVEGNGSKEFQAFLEMYDQMMARKKFETSTNVHQFDEIQRALPKEHRMRIFLCRRDGVPVAGLVGSAMGDTGIYLHGATSDEGLNLKGAYLLQWRMIQWLKETGVRYYNLGGINPETNPGVYHFKKGLSGQDLLYLTPFAACENFLSSIISRVADFRRAGFQYPSIRSIKSRVSTSRSKKRPTTESAAPKSFGTV